MIREYLAKHQGMVYPCGIGAIARIGFGILYTSVRIVTSLFGGFFYVLHSVHSYGGLRGRASARRSLGCGIPIPFNLPPEFGISDGWNLTNGVSL